MECQRHETCEMKYANKGPDYAIQGKIVQLIKLPYVFNSDYDDIYAVTQYVILFENDQMSQYYNITGINCILMYV